MQKLSSQWASTKAIKRPIRSYNDLVDISSFEGRYEYLKLGGNVGESTFGYDRFMNQTFYKSPEWKRVRELVMIRDLGRDLAIEGYDINGRIIIHHMNPMSIADLSTFNQDVINPRFLICTSHQTHQAIHYGDASLLPQTPIIRRPGDTKLW